MFGHFGKITLQVEGNLKTFTHKNQRAVHVRKSSFAKEDGILLRNDYKLICS
jgi:hypothetical protein